jgi:hypothetical protein
MIELSPRLFVCLMALLAAAPVASSQTPRSDSSSSQVAAGKSGKPRNNRRSGATSGASPSLCFQPGVGWQSTFTDQPIEPESGLASEAKRQSANPRLPGVQPAHSTDCAGNVTDERIPGVGVGKKFTPLNRAIGSAGSMTKPGKVTPRPVYLNGAGILNGSGASKPARMTPSAVASAPTSAAPEAPADQPGGRAFHAYISSIKLRRLIRNASDFRTRIKLQQLQNNPANQPHHARGDTKPGSAAGRPLQAERVSRVSGSVTRGGPRDHPGTLLSGAQR